MNNKIKSILEMIIEGLLILTSKEIRRERVTHQIILSFAAAFLISVSENETRNKVV